MHKVKTKSAAKKRFLKVGSKKNVKVKYSKAFRRHLLTKKSAKKKRQLRGGSYFVGADRLNVLKLLPY